MGANILNATPTNRSQLKCFQTYPEFSSQWSAQKCIWDFQNFNFFLYSLSWGSMGVECQHATPATNRTQTFKLVLNFLSNSPPKNTFGFFNFELPIFNDYFRKFHIHICTTWGNQKP